MSDKKPVIFISYSHRDEPEHPRDGEVQWLSFVRTYLQPAVKHGVFDLWVDRHMPGSADWGPEIEEKLRACDIFILLISAYSMASDYIIDKEIAIIRERQSRGELVYFYPLLLTPTPKAGLDKVQDKNLRPRDAKPFSGYAAHDRAQHMSDAADEIAALVEQVAKQKVTAWPSAALVQPAYVHITGLPETAYEKLQGRDDQLKRLDDAWADQNTNILSLIAEGGAGKSALVNEWLKRLQADNYRGAEVVLGWSFYNQGTKERANSSDEFLNWAIDRLGIKTETINANEKSEAIAGVISRHRVLLVLDGCEPLQHGLDKQQGELKDAGLRYLIRRFASMSPAQARGLIVLTSRLQFSEIARWKDTAAPVVDVEELSEEAGAALLHDNGVWGTGKQLQAAARDFAGHPLALGLLASFIKETQFGDIRRRDHVRAFFADPENPRHDHARRVMESYEKEWLANEPIEHTIMHLVGLFDRPASGESLQALREKPVISGLTDAIVDLDEAAWRRAVTRLRNARLLAPTDPSAPGALDTHPLVREWFGDRLRKTNEVAWKIAHGRLYEYLRDSTKEGKTPTLENLAPLYQAIAHGCRAERYQEVLLKIYVDRICRRFPNGQLAFYSNTRLGVVGSDLAALSWFFDKAYEKPVDMLEAALRPWLLGQAAFGLRAQGRFAESLPALRAALQMYEEAKDWVNAAIGVDNLSETELVVGNIPAAIAMAEQSVVYSDRSGNELRMIVSRTTRADAVSAAGRREEAEGLFADAESRQKLWQPEYPLLYSVQGYAYCDFVLTKGQYAVVQDRATTILEWETETDSILDCALVRLAIARSHLGLALLGTVQRRVKTIGSHTYTACFRVDEAIDGLRSSGQNDHFPRGLLARSVFCRSVGDWNGAARELDEVREVAESGPMKLFLCEMALELARLSFAKIEAFAPLNGLTDDSPRKPVAPDAAEVPNLKEEARKQLAISADYIKSCGYHRRDEELAELQAVLRGERKFADLPPRV